LLICGWRHFFAAQTAFLEALSHDSAAAVSAQPHVLETLAPCLQGPLNLNAASLKPSTARRIACTMALSSSSSEGLDSQPGASFSALLTGFSSGTVYAHALQLEHLVPCWEDTSPQVCALGQEGQQGQQGRALNSTWLC
jgi:hypothetical protein